MKAVCGLRTNVAALFMDLQEKKSVELGEAGERQIIIQITNMIELVGIKVDNKIRCSQAKKKRRLGGYDNA